jgi:hypothetical protein
MTVSSYMLSQGAMFTFTKRNWAKLILPVLIFMLVAEMPRAQEDTLRVSYYVGKAVRRHPDGAVGTATFHGMGQYQLVTKPDGVPSTDIQKYRAELGWVAGDYVNFMTSFLIVNEDSLRYEFNGGVKIYTRNPVTSTRKKNADGVIGAPVITMGGGLRYSDFAITDTKFVGDISILLPASERFSALAGYRHYDELEEADVVQGYAGVNFYLAGYNSDSAYANPDGPSGMMAFHLTGGGSSNGMFGDLTLLLPINDNLTWKIAIRGERVPEPYRRVAILGAGFSFYPSN